MMDVIIPAAFCTLCVCAAFALGYALGHRDGFNELRSTIIRMVQRNVNSGKTTRAYYDASEDELWIGKE